MALPSVVAIVLVIACSTTPAPHPSLPAAPPLPVQAVPLGAAESQQISLPQAADVAAPPDDAGVPADARHTTLELADEQDLRILMRFDPAACAGGDGSELEISVIAAGQVHALRVTTDNAPAVCNAHARQVETGDFNFDGRKDLAIPVDSSGPYGALTYAVLLQQPSDGQFLEAPLLSALTRESMGLFSVDSSKRRLITSGKSGCCIHYQEDFAVQGDHPQSIGAETITHRFENDHCFVITERSGTRGQGVHKRACRRDEL